jgi:arylsulfatase
VKSWDSLSAQQQANKARDMEVYAAMVDYMDEQIGRVYQWLEANSELDNTLIVFLSDNGANGFPARLYPGHDDEYHARFDNSLENRGASGSFIVMGAGWATASTAAYRLLKGFSTEGGIRTPAIVRFPDGSSEGEIQDAFVHVRDLMPTFLELANAHHPAREDSALAALAGKSLVPLFEGRVGSTYENEGIGYELHGTRAYIKGDWKALQMPLPLGSGKWELYNLATDPAETKNLADTEPEKLAELVADHAAYEKEQGVIYSLPSVLNRFVQAQQLLFVLLWATLACFVYALMRGHRKSAIASIIVSVSSLLLVLYTKSGQLLALMF